MRTRAELRHYQVRTSAFQIEQERTLCALKMGMGKTASTLTTIHDLIDACVITKALVIAPLRVANSVWAQEAKEWEHLKDLKFKICTGTEQKRLAALHHDADVYVINRENVVWLVKHYRDKFPFQMVVIDESSSFKSDKSKRVKALRKALPYVHYITLLTGTPSPNGLLDLWSQCYLVDNGKALGRTMTMYKSRFFEQDYSGYKYTPRKDSQKKIEALIAPFTISMETSDYLEMPDYIELYEEIELPPTIMNNYKLLEEKLYLKFEESEVEALSAATLANKLLQYCAGAVYVDEFKNYEIVHDAKLDALADIIEQNDGENILVAYNFKSDIERLLKRFPNARVLDKHQNTIDEWNNGEIPLLFAHPACLHPSTEVLTEHRGWTKIVDVKKDERVFDGIEFVSHSGCHFSGVKEVIDVMGITMTENHKILIDDKWVEAKNVQNNIHTRRKANYSYSGTDAYLSSMLPLRGNTHNIKTKCFKSEQREQKTLFKMRKRKLSFNDKYKNLEYLEGDDKSNNERIRSKLHSIWWKRQGCCERMVRFQEFLFRYERNIFRQSNFRSDRQFKRLFQRQLPMGNKYGTTSKQNKQQGFSLQRQTNALVRILQGCEHKQRSDNRSFKFRNDSGGCCDQLFKFKVSEKPTFSEVFDLVDCGTRNRFLVRNNNGEVFISHNSAGHGLNIQHGGSMIVWFSLSWSLEYYQQFNARLYRQGQTMAVRIIHLICKGCIDERIINVLKDKDIVQSDLLRALK